MVKPLSFKGDKKIKKRKHRDHPEDDDARITSQERAVVPAAAAAPAGDETADEQSWVSADVPTDINGPVIFVLPSTPPTCLACDANGKVFASGLENMIENDPGTAEPHDVRQVWVATKVAGSEAFGFKGHHGRFVFIFLALVPAYNNITGVLTIFCLKVSQLRQIRNPQRHRVGHFSSRILHGG